MKRLDFIKGAIALTAVMILTVNPVALAQENGNRDMDGKIVRGPYETNRFGDNWFIGASGGVNVFLNDSYDAAIAPSVDAYLGKWFTPSVGMRVGYQGFQTKVWSEFPTFTGSGRDADNDEYPLKTGYMYIHGDFLWNMSDALSGYKETRFWNFIPYIHTGFYRSYGLDDVDFSKNEFAMGAGLIHNLRLAQRLDLVIDMRATMVSGAVVGSSGPSLLGSVTAGLAVDLGWPAFVRTSTVMSAVELANMERIAVMEAAAIALEAANEALEQENTKLVKSNKILSDQISENNENLPPQADLSVFFEGMSPSVFFEIGKTVLCPKELRHLEFIAESLLSKAESETDIVVTVMGTADKNTGSSKRNQFLSEQRGQYVYEILTEKYGISSDRIVIRSEIVNSTGDPSFDRAVVFTF